MVRKKNKDVIVFRNVALVIVVLSIIGVAAVRISDARPQVSGDAITALAQCLSDKGVKLYGAKWCSHCQKQKQAFGEAASIIDYVDCAIPGDPRGQIEECQRVGITSYPTWHFSLGHRETGELSFKELANNAGCPWGEIADTNPEEMIAPEITIDLYDFDSKNVKVE